MAVVQVDTGSITPGALNVPEPIVSVAATAAVPGTYVLYLERATMAAADVLLVTAIMEIDGTDRVLWTREVTDAPVAGSTDPNEQDVVVMGPHTDATGVQLRFELEQTAGTLRTYDYELHGVLAG